MAAGIYNTKSEANHAASTLNKQSDFYKYKVVTKYILVKVKR
jgi:hypothetical protein